MPLESLLERRSASGTRSVNSMTSSMRLRRSWPVVAERAGVEVEVLEHRHVLVVAEVVGHPADEPAHLGRVVDDVDAADLGGPHGRVVERGEDPHGGRLAGAVGADEAADRAVRDLERDAVDGLQSRSTGRGCGRDGGHGAICDGECESDA